MNNPEFNCILVKNQEYLRPFAVTLTHDQDKAKDLVQETMYRALENKEKYQVGTNIKAWLYTIMRNIFINDYRRRARQHTILDSSSTGYILNAQESTVNNDAVDRINEKEIWLAIHKLPEIFRKPFLLYYYGFKYQHIAEEMNEPLGTIKSRIHFARRLLRGFINKRHAFGLN